MRPKENSTRPALDAVTNNAYVSAKDASAAAKPRPQEPPLPDQLAESIVAHSEFVQREGHTEFRLQLEPPELGSVRVHLTTTDGGIRARLFVHDPSARQLIQSQLESLRQRLKEQGIMVGRFDVSGNDAGSAGQRHSKSERGMGNPDSGRMSKEASPARKAGTAASRVVDVVV